MAGVAELAESEGRLEELGVVVLCAKAAPARLSAAMARVIRVFINFSKACNQVVAMVHAWKHCCVRASAVNFECRLQHSVGKRSERDDVPAAMF